MALAYPISTLLPPLTGKKEVCKSEVSSDTGVQNFLCKNPLNTTAVSTTDLCLQYSFDNNAFLSAFAVAYTKMTTVGYGVPAAVDGATSTGKLGTLTAIDLSTCSV